MKTVATESRQGTQKTVASRQLSQSHNDSDPKKAKPLATQFDDGRPDAVSQLRLQEMAGKSADVRRRARLQATIDGGPQNSAQRTQLDRIFGQADRREEARDETSLQTQDRHGTIWQQVEEDDQSLQGTTEQVPRQVDPEEEEALQGNSDPVQAEDPLVIIRPEATAQKRSRGFTDQGSTMKTRVHQTARSGAVIQRFISSAEFLELAGKPSLKGRSNKSLYNDIVTLLELYESDPSLNTLDEINKKIGDWLEKPEHQEKKAYRRRFFLEALRTEIGEVQGTRQVAFGPRKSTLTPSSFIELVKDSATNSDEIEAKLSGREKGNFQFSVRAVITHEDYLDFAKKRLELTIREKKPKLRRRSKKSALLKTEAANAVVTEKHHDLSEEERLAKIKEIENIGRQVGHTWIEFRQSVAETTEEDSFGFIPAIGPDHHAPPNVAMPGLVRSPDEEFAQEPKQIRKDSPITPKRYMGGMRKAIELMKSPPDYKLTGYNCTTFAEEVAKAAGENFPKGAYMRVPLVKPIADPNSLYHSLKGEKETYNPEQRRGAEEVVRKDEEQRANEVNRAELRRKLDAGGLKSYTLDYPLYVSSEPEVSSGSIGPESDHPDIVDVWGGGVRVRGVGDDQVHR